MVLLHLAPVIREYILFLSAADARFVTELGLRKIAREPRWDRQRDFSSSFFRIDLHVGPHGVINVMTRRLPRKRKTSKMTTSKKKTKHATAPTTTKARVAKRRAPAAPLKAEPALKPAGAKKSATAARGGSKTEKILDLLKRPSGVSLKELVKATGWQPHSVRDFLSGTIGKKMGTPAESFKDAEGERCTASPPSNLSASAADSPAALVSIR
jgi:hypothetical protein